MAKTVLEKIGILLNNLERNSSGGNEDKQNEDVESVMARLYPSGRDQGGERKRLKHVRAHAAADAIFFIRMTKISLVFLWCYATKGATMQTAKERQRQEKVSRDNLKNILTLNLGILAVF